MRRLFFVAVVVFLSTGCGKKIIETWHPYEYCLQNASDHVITMRVEELYDYDDVFPEELTLLPGENFSWQNSYLGFQPFFATSVTVTFDRTYTLLSVQNIPTLQSWVFEERGKKELPLATYTFTNADYEYAVENGTVVE